LSDGAGTTRRGALKRALLIAGGAFGVGTASGATLDGDRSGAEPSAAPRTNERLSLHARNLTHYSPDRGAGRMASTGDRVLARGDLHEGGRKTGEFVSTGFSLDARTVSNLELHTISLRDGSLLGMGAAGESGGTYALVGGTGRFTGAQGAYELRRDLRGGTATITVDLRI
jgi:hypothetical protein